MPFNVGENVGPYRIIEQLGQGGMATVLKAYHASLDRYVALKVLHPAFNQDANFEARFQREARVVAKLEHPNIVPVYDYAEHEKRPYLVMKFIEGITLKARMEQGPLSPDEVAKIADAVGSALAYAHKQGVLHRDIKPSNVLVTNDGQVYLADFGLARIAQSGESTLSSDMIMGTPQYISPEQAMGVKELDQRTDLYSFGVMLYEMVVGKVPFSADTPFSIIHDHIYTPLPLPHTVNPNIPESVERVLLKALAKERDDRYEEATQLVTAFKEAWNDFGQATQGSDTDVPQAVQMTEEIVTPPTTEPTKVAEKPEPTKVAAAPVPPLKAEEAPQVAGTVPKSGMKRSPWIWIGAALFIIILCISTAWLVRKNHPLATLLNSRNNAPAATQALPPEPGSQPPSSESAPQPLPPQPAQPDQPGQPNPPNQPDVDAGAHLNLALEAWQQQDLQRSMDEVNQAIALSAEQNDFLLQAGTQLFDARQYIGATIAYGHAEQNFQNNHQPLPPDVRGQFEASVYFATEMNEFPHYIPFDSLRNNDPPIALFAQSRFALLHGNMDLAHSSLDELLRVQPMWPLAQLLNAEIMFHDGNPLEARKTLQNLMQAPQVSDWIKQQADMLLSTNQ